MTVQVRRMRRLSRVPQQTPDAHYRFTVEQYDLMVKEGILDKYDHVELIDGAILQMSPIGWNHASHVMRLNSLFIERFGHRMTLGVQGPIVLGDRSEPQPDVALLVHRKDFYAGHHPRAEEVLLAVEVSDTTYRRDSKVKLPLYARQGVREAMLLDLKHDCVEIHRRPAKSGYRSVRRLRRGEKFSLLAFPDVTLSVEDILGPK